MSKKVLYGALIVLGLYLFGNFMYNRGVAAGVKAAKA